MPSGQAPRREETAGLQFEPPDHALPAPAHLAPPSPPQRPSWERGIRVPLKDHGTTPLIQPETRGMAPTALDGKRGGLRSHKAARCPGTTCDLPEERGPPGAPSLGLRPSRGRETHGPRVP